MGYDGIQADTNALSQAGQQYTAAADELRTVAQNLAGRLAGLGNFWGGDQFGQDFAAKYVGPVDKWMSFAGVASGQGLPSIADSVGSWAQAYQNGMQQESQAAQSVAGAAS
jgi:uncharacterized protein YukE